MGELNHGVGLGRGPNVTGTVSPANRAPPVSKSRGVAIGTLARYERSPTMAEPPAANAWYTARGEGENWSKDLKAGCFADRLRCHRFWANQFRLLLHAAAFWLLDALRCWPASVGVPRMA